MKQLIVDNISLELVKENEDGSDMAIKTFSVIADPEFWEWLEKKELVAFRFKNKVLK